MQRPLPVHKTTLTTDRHPYAVPAPARFEAANSESERPKTHVLAIAAKWELQESMVYMK
jgi:hypothetical protein